MVKNLRFLFWSYLLIKTFLAFGQSYDDIINTNRYIGCQDVLYNAESILEKTLANNQIDSVYLFLDYWESKCGFIEPAFRLRNILDIKTNKFVSDSIK